MDHLPHHAGFVGHHLPHHSDGGHDHVPHVGGIAHHGDGHDSVGRHLPLHAGGLGHSTIQVATPYYGGHTGGARQVIYAQSYSEPEQSVPYRSPDGSYLEQGRQHLTEHDYNRAVDTLLQAVLQQPEAGLPKLLFGHALAAAGDYGYATYAIRRGLARIRGPVPFTGAGLYGDAAEFDRVLYKVKHDAERKPADTDARFLLGYFEQLAQE